MARRARDLAKKRVALLTEWKEVLRQWWVAEQGDLALRESDEGSGRYHPDSEGQDERRTFILKNMMAVGQAFDDLEMDVRKNVGPYILALQQTRLVRTVNPLSADLFQKHYGKWLMPDLIDALTAAIGAYEAQCSGSGLVATDDDEFDDVLASIMRGTRIGFATKAPNDEKAVQDAVEAQLAAHKLKFTREKESRPFGVKSIRPDFIVEDWGSIPLEVKYTRESRRPGPIQGEIAEDITAFGQHWHRMVFLIYDDGLLYDPTSFEADNEALDERVTLRVIKH